MPGVDDDMVLHIVHIQTAIDHLEVNKNIYQDDPSLPPFHLSLSDGHPVVVHLVKTEVSVGMQGLARYNTLICAR